MQRPRGRTGLGGCEDKHDGASTADCRGQEVRVEESQRPDHVASRPWPDSWILFHVEWEVTRRPEVGQW